MSRFAQFTTKNNEGGNGVSIVIDLDHVIGFEEVQEFCNKPSLIYDTTRVLLGTHSIYLEIPYPDFELLMIGDDLSKLIRLGVTNVD